MHMSLKGLVVGTLAVAGATFATADAQAMPVQPLGPAAASAAPLEHVFYYGYGYRRPFLVRPFYGYRRFGYGYRRPFFYGYRRPFYRYGYRRW